MIQLSDLEGLEGAEPARVAFAIACAPAQVRRAQRACAQAHLKRPPRVLSSSGKRREFGLALDSSLKDAGEIQEPGSHLLAWAFLQALTPPPLPCRVQLPTSIPSLGAPQSPTASPRAGGPPQDARRGPPGRARRRGWRRL